MRSSVSSIRTTTPVHLRKPSSWQTYRGRRGSLSRCQEQNKPGDRRANKFQQNREWANYPGRLSRGLWIFKHNKLAFTRDTADNVLVMHPNASLQHAIQEATCKSRLNVTGLRIRATKYFPSVRARKCFHRFENFLTVVYSYFLRSLFLDFYGTTLNAITLTEGNFRFRFSLDLASNPDISLVHFGLIVKDVLIPPVRFKKCNKLGWPQLL